MTISVVTLFPELIQSFAGTSIPGRVLERGLARVRTINPRDYTTDRHRTVDDYPYGGGPGMVLKPEPLCAAVDSLGDSSGPVVLLSPGGSLFNQATATEWAGLSSLTLVCGHYEGVDERFVRTRVDHEISIGDYVLSGGEAAALVVIDTVLRLLPGAIAEGSLESESHVDGLLEYPHYTRPGLFEGLVVPEVLRSGNHALIRQWRRYQQLIRTRERRPDLLSGAELDATDRRLIGETEGEHNGSAEDD